MKAIILAGGLGSRLSEETTLRPKPMVEIGGKPILWHIMNTYSVHNIDEFIIALGYKQEIVKEYFLNFYALNNDISLDLATGKTNFHNGTQPNWKVHLVDTGLSHPDGWTGQASRELDHPRGDFHVDIRRRRYRSGSLGPAKIS